MYVSSGPRTLLRPLGNIEQMFWLKNQHMPYHFAVCAEIDGPTTVMAWRAALEKVQRRHPNFSVRIEPDQNGTPCFHRAAGVPIPLRVVASDNPHWEREMERELATPFGAGQAPLVRAVLLYRPYRTFLILSAHHSIADTKSLVFAIRDALLVLSGEPLDPLPSIGSLDAWLQRFRTMARDDGSDPGSFPPAGPLDVYRTPDGLIPCIKGLTLAPALTNELRQRSRTERTTVHGALVAAAVEAARRLSDELRSATINVGSAVDFRTAVGAGEDVALLSAGGSTPVEPQMQDFWEIARFAKRSIAPIQSPEAMCSLMGGLGKYLSTRPDEKQIGALMAGFRFDINISNLGNLPIETRFGYLTFAKLWGPSILAGFEGEQEIGVATINGSLNLLHTSYKPLPSLLESIEERLAAACS
jgi:hypothetical protein